MELTLTLPWPPSVNHYKTIGALTKTKSGKLYQKRVNSRETIGYYYQVFMHVKQLMPLEWAKIPDDGTKAFFVGIDLYPPNKRRYDIDNRLKVLLDSLVHANVIKDDHQIHRLFVQKMRTIGEGKVVVRIQELI